MCAYLSALLFCNTKPVIVQTCKEPRLLMTPSIFHFIPSSLLYHQHYRLLKNLLSFKHAILMVLLGLKTGPTSPFSSSSHVPLALIRSLSQYDSFYSECYLFCKCCVSAACAKLHPALSISSKERCLTDLVLMLLFTLDLSFITER